MGWLTPYIRSGRRGNHEDHVNGKALYTKHGVWAGTAQDAKSYTRMPILFFQNNMLNMLANCAIFVTGC